MRLRGRDWIIHGRLLGCIVPVCSDEVGGLCEWRHEVLIIVNNGHQGHTLR